MPLVSTIKATKLSLVLFTIGRDLKFLRCPQIYFLRECEMIEIMEEEFFGGFFKCIIQHCFIGRPSDSTVAENVRIEPKTFATMTLAV